MMSRCIAALALIAMVLSASPAQGQDALVRTQLKSEGPFWVGERITVVVELLVPGYFASASAFDLPDPSGVLLMPPQTHPLVSSEAIDGNSYTVQRHELPAWAIRNDASGVPAFTVRVSFKRNPLDKDGEPATLTTQALPISVRIPPGAEGLGTVISARGLDISDTWDPQPGADPVKAGDALKRTVTFSAADVPGMLFPQLPTQAIDGIGIYPKHQVRDQAERGVMRGESVDQVTYVFERPGQFVIPAAQLTWFDLDSNTLKTHTFEAQAVSVIANPALAPTSPGANAGETSIVSTWVSLPRAVQVFLVLVSLLALGLIAILLSPNARVGLTRWSQPLRPVHLSPLNPVTHRRR
ncbi:protein BatD [Marinihelvus fidelis]|uniref:Protein BatD n=1 Tax=Marinihelvus fidelis TaxID=2613842 RepID=A0A5N0TJM4_9GAMM|nr:BatD family protein [Marinihelvus fidelis]KAA9133529.1 protein BatD [Marinihelvus fidelis]